MQNRISIIEGTKKREKEGDFQNAKTNFHEEKENGDL
jgi:hypothetical protein